MRPCQQLAHNPPHGRVTWGSSVRSCTVAPDIVGASPATSCVSFSSCYQLITHLTFLSTQLRNHGRFPCGSCQSSPTCFFFSKGHQGEGKTGRSSGCQNTKIPAETPISHHKSLTLCLGLSPPGFASHLSAERSTGRSHSAAAPRDSPSPCSKH